MQLLANGDGLKGTKEFDAKNNVRNRDIENGPFNSRAYSQLAQWNQSMAICKGFGCNLCIELLGPFLMPLPKFKNENFFPQNLRNFFNAQKVLKQYIKYKSSLQIVSNLLDINVYSASFIEMNHSTISSIYCSVPH